MALLCEAFVKEAARIRATSSEVISAALSIVGGSSIKEDGNNKRAIVAGLRELANLIEGGQLSATTPEPPWPAPRHRLCIEVVYEAR